jgi:hypothetical protein
LLSVVLNNFFLSSISVNGNCINGKVLTENNPSKPKEPYTISKKKDQFRSGYYSPTFGVWTKDAW